jgi:transcriptional regulator with XRE-family HTH domain
MSAEDKPGATMAGDGQDLEALAAEITEAAPPLSDDQRRQLPALPAARTAPSAGRSAGGTTGDETRAHGTRARYAHGPGPGKGPGCRCGDCTAANRAAETKRSHAIRYGRWQPYVDAAPVREHLDALFAAGIGRRRVGELAGVSSGSLSKILYGARGRPPSRRVRPQTAAAILAVKPGPEQLAPGALVDITGTRRRAQALVATGWSQARLAGELGLTPANFCAMLRGDQVTAATAQAVGGLYDRLWNQPPPEHDQRTRIAASRARHHAEREGWVPPLAWDDDQIDDPDSRPAEGWKRPARTRRTSAELAEDAQELIRRQGYTREHAAGRLGVSLSNLEQAISRASRAERHAAPAGHDAQRARFAQAAKTTPEAEADYEAEAG